MNGRIVHDLYAGIAPWAALSLVLMGRNPFLSRLRIIGSLLLAFFLLRIPVGGWNGFSWCRMLESHPALVTTVLLLTGLHDRCASRKWFRPCDWRAAWIFGAVAALALYPMGLGLTATDPYAWGWSRGFTLLVPLLALILIIGGIRFGFLLLLCVAAFPCGLQGSENRWDAVIDPFYAVVSMVAGLVPGVSVILRRMART